MTPESSHHPVDDAVDTDELMATVERLSSIREEMLEASGEWEPWIADRTADRDASARNLLQYLVLRSHDLRDLQLPLIALGLSSLGRSEGHVQATVDAVLEALSRMMGLPAVPPAAPPAGPPPIGFAHSRELLALRTGALLGPAPRTRRTRIMVTMPADAATEPDLVHEMLRAGMDCVRINCAHDAPDAWWAMLGHVRRAEERSGRRTRLLVDLPGPKLRTVDSSRLPEQDGKGRYARLNAADRLILCRSDSASSPDEGIVRIGCSLPEAFAATEPGHHVWLDDGKFGGIVEAADDQTILVRITHAPPKGAKLRGGKGINLPDAVLDIDVLTANGAEALPFATTAADMVGLSFVSHPHDVHRVAGYLDEHASRQVGMVLKIETRRAFEQLPGMLLAALGSERPAGVMIARGDLAVECGYERLAEVQEEILWLCQAAHLPVIWATEVLDRLAKTGRPSRAEITDAAMGIQAECVMLNKGPRIVEAISTLDDILGRMDRHHSKKRPLLPRLSAAEYVPTR